jgi:hypothetical protein
VPAPASARDAAISGEMSADSDARAHRQPQRRHVERRRLDDLRRLETRRAERGAWERGVRDLERERQRLAVR